MNVPTNRAAGFFMRRAFLLIPALKFIFIFASACALAASACRSALATTDAEIKNACKNKCQYMQSKTCYEDCLREGVTTGAGQARQQDQKKEVTWEDLVKQAQELFDQQDYDNASKVYEQLIAMDPQAAVAHYNLGICYEHMGRNSQAIEEYQKYLDIKPYAEDRPEVEAWVRRLNQQPAEERQRYQMFTIASSPAGKVKLRLVQSSDVRMRVDVISPEPFNYKIVEKEEPATLSMRAYLTGYAPTREVIPVWRGGIKEILLHWEQDEEDPARRSYLLISIRLEHKPRSSEPFSGFTDGYVNYDAIDDQIYTFEMNEDERMFSFVFDIHLLKKTTFLDKVDIKQVPLRDICQPIAKLSGKSCIIDFRLFNEWEKQDRYVTYSNEKIFVENLLDYFGNMFHFRWVETDNFYMLLSEPGFEWLAQNSVFYDMRPMEKPDMSAKVLNPVDLSPKNIWDILDYWSNWHYISFKESVVWRIKDSAEGGEGVRNAGVLQGGPTLEEFLTAYCVANSLYWFRIWDAYFLTDRPDRIGRFVELAQLGDWQKKPFDKQPARFGFDDFDLTKESRYDFRWALIDINYKNGAWALRDMEKAIDRAPESADVYYYSGVACVVEQKYDLAIRAFQRAVRIRPDFTLARFMLARSYQKYNDLRDAIEEYRLALGYDPDFAPAARELALLYTKSGLIKESVKYLKTAVDVMPADMDSQYELSRALYFNGEYEESWNHLIVARPTEYVALSFPQIQRRLILEFGQLWHKDWYKYDSQNYYTYPNNYYSYPGWYYDHPDWKNANPGYYQEGHEGYRAFPAQNYNQNFDQDKNKYKTGEQRTNPINNTQPK